MSFKRATSGSGSGVPKADSAGTAVAASISAAPATLPTLPGSRRWIDGTLIVSSGHAMFDTILNGGLPCGSITLLETDWRAVHANTLASLNLGEGIAVGHKVIVASATLSATNDLLAQVPLNISAGSKDASALVACPEGDDAGVADSSSLRIAQSYKKYLDASGSASGRESTKYCHTFDLNRQIPAEVLQAASPVEMVVPSCVEELDGFLTRLRAACSETVINRVVLQLHVNGHLSASPASRFQHLFAGQYTNQPARCIGGAFGLEGCDPELAAGMDSGHRLLVMLMMGLRREISSWDVSTVVLVSLDTHNLPIAVATEIRTICDASIKLHAFTDPGYAIGFGSRHSATVSAAAGTAPEFADFHGLLLVRKITRFGSASGATTDTLTYVFKRDRRKFIIEKPHLPPEDTGKSETLGCASSGAASSVDF